MSSNEKRRLINVSYYHYHYQVRRKLGVSSWVLTRCQRRSVTREKEKKKKEEEKTQPESNESKIKI